MLFRAWMGDPNTKQALLFGPLSILSIYKAFIFFKKSHTVCYFKEILNLLFQVDQHKID